jgi:hypothetical protein
MRFDFSAIKSTAKALTDRLHELDVEVSQLRVERYTLESAPAAKSDVREAVKVWVRATAENFKPAFASQLERLVVQPQHLADPSTAIGYFGIAGRANEPDAAVSVSQVDSLLCACFGAQMLPVLMKAVDEATWTEGPTLAERALRIKEIDSRVAKALAEIARLRAEALAAGLDV